MLNKLVLVVCALAAVPYFVSSYQVTVVKTTTGYIIQPKDTNSDEGNKLTPRIIGGGEASPHYYDFQAALLLYKGRDTFFCGGTLITSLWVLTAASCLEIKPNYITVILGAHDLLNLESNKVQVYNSTKYKSHKEWDRNTLQNDVGMIRLPNVVLLNKYVNTAKVASGTNAFVGEYGFILGWGKTETQGMSTILQQVISKVISNEECANASASYKDIIKPTHICTSGEGPKGSCNGDAGGPVLVDGRQVGIISFGTADCTLGMPSVATRMTEIRAWIQAHLGDDGYDDHDDDDDDDDKPNTRILHYTVPSVAENHWERV